MVCMECDAYYRLVFRFKQPKFQVFAVCKVSEEAFDVGLVRSKVQYLWEMCRSACEHCVDPLFAVVWLRRLFTLSDRVCRDAHLALSDLLATLRHTSAKCERKHLLGQTVKSYKRGRAPEPAMLSKHTYRRSVCNESASARAVVLENVLPTAQLRSQFNASIKHFQTGHEYRRTMVATQARGHKRKASALSLSAPVHLRRIRGYDIYLRNVPKPVDCGSRFEAEAKRAYDGYWKTMPPLEKAGYLAKAEAENERREKLRDVDMSEYVRCPSDHSESRSARIAEKRSAALKTVKKITEHPILNSGLGISCFEAALAPEHVILEPRAQIHKKMR